MGSKRKNVDALTKDLEEVIRKLYTQMQGTYEEKREAIIQEVGTSIESVEKARQERQEERQRKIAEYERKKRERAKELRKQKKEAKLDRFKQRAGQIPDDINTLMKEFGYESKSIVFANMRKNGIYGKNKILQAIKEKAELGISEEEANAQIAKEGNITLEAVARIRNQKKERPISSKQTERKEAIKQRKQEKENRIDRFRKRAAQIPDDIKTLRQEFNCKQATIYIYMRNNRIYGKNKILQAIKEKAELGISEEEANAQIAREGNITPEAVARIRNQKKERPISSKQTERKEAIKQRKQEKENRIDRFKQRAAQIPDDLETLRKEFGYSNLSSVFHIMTQYGIYNRKAIRKAIKEKTELGISEEEANMQIAKEGNVTLEAVVRIRNQEKEKAISSKQTKRKEAIKQRKQEKENRIDRFKQRAAQIPDDIETLKKEFEYSNQSAVLSAMTRYGIYNRKAIRQAIKEKADLGISEEEANMQIAEEGNITLEAVARIRQRISKPKTKTTRTNVKPSSTKTIATDKSEVQTDARTVAVQSRVAEPKTEQSAKATEEPKVKTLEILESRQTPSKPIPHTKNTKASQREIDQKQWKQELDQAVKNKIKEKQEIEQETEIFLKMAREFWPSSSIKGKFQYIDDYDMILIRRKHKILSREEVEELIETTSLSDEEIAQKANGVVAGVKKVRESIRQRQELIARVPDTKRNFIIESIKQSRIC